jgi:hypothetical protein
MLEGLWSIELGIREIDPRIVCIEALIYGE